MTEKGSGESKLWGGRFKGATDTVMEKFNKSIDIDKIMWKADILGSKAYAEAIAKVGLLTENELSTLSDGLDRIRQEWENGTFKVQESDEDIHTAHERRLTEIVGPVGGKLHTGRSRNDQVTTDMRLWLREAIQDLDALLLSTIDVILARARSEIEVIMPGYTHLQRAQPILWSHLLMSYGWMFSRDADRLMEVRKRVNVLTLGSGALAGNPFNIDRNSLAVALEFPAISQNSLDGTSDRDFIAEFLFWASLCSSHVSKLAEDFIIYSTAEFGFIKLADAYSTGSSLMPQKKNADSLELLRAKAGRVFGQCAGFMTVLKGIPSTYNKDLQEDKEAMMSVYDTMRSVLQITRGVVESCSVDVTRCRAAVTADMLSTDVAYHLVTAHRVPFREAHGAAGRAVLLAEGQGSSLDQLTLDQWKTIDPRLDHRVLSLWDPAVSVERYSVVGGTAPCSVLTQLDTLTDWRTSHHVTHHVTH